MLGKLPVPGRPTILITVGQGPTALAVGVGCLVIFTLIYRFSPLSPSLWETARYRLKYCLKGPLNPKQPTNQLIVYTTPRSCCIDMTAAREALHMHAIVVVLVAAVINSDNLLYLVLFLPRKLCLNY